MYVSLVVRGSLSNVIRNLKKAVRFGDYFEIFVSCSDVIKSKFGQKDSTRILFVNDYKNYTSQQ